MPHEHSNNGNPNNSASVFGGTPPDCEPRPDIRDEREMGGCE